MESVSPDCTPSKARVQQAYTSRCLLSNISKTKSDTVNISLCIPQLILQSKTK